jgi:hypothetical protein
VGARFWKSIKLRVSILTASERRTDDLSRDAAIDDAIAAVAEDGPAVVPAGNAADERQAGSRDAERASPLKSRPGVGGGQQFRERGSSPSSKSRACFRARARASVKVLRLHLPRPIQCAPVRFRFPVLERVERLSSM